MDDVRVVSKAKSSADDLVISAALRFSPARLPSQPARTLAKGRPSRGMASSAAAIMQLPAPGPFHQPGTSSYSCPKQAYSAEDGRDSYSQVDLNWMTESVMVGRVLEMQELHWRLPRPECPRPGSHCVFLRETHQETYPKTCKPQLCQII